MSEQDEAIRKVAREAAIVTGNDASYMEGVIRSVLRDFEKEDNPYQPQLRAPLTFSVNGRGDIFLWFESPDLVLEFHPGDYYYDALLRWCRAKMRQQG